MSEEVKIAYTVKETVQKIDSKMDAMAQKIDNIERHVQLTNGRVTTLETNPMNKMGSYMVQNPWRTILLACLFSILFFSIVISDIRHPLIEFIARVII